MRKALVIAAVITALMLHRAHAAEDAVSMNFANADITMVIKYISEMTGKNFIVDSKVQGKVTILSPRKVSKAEAFKVFESILAVYGFSAVTSGDVTKIVPTAEARVLGGTGARAADLSPEQRDHMITQLIPLRFVSADNMVNALRPLIPPTSYIAAYTQSNTIIVVDMESNLKRIFDIVQRLDVEGRETNISVIPLKHASAKDLAAKIQTISGRPATPQPMPPGQEQAAVMADDRLNAIIVLGNELFQNRVKNLVAQLDVESPPGRQEINVVYLNFANADDLAKVVNQILAAEKKPVQPGQPGQESVFVTADKVTNSLIVTASPEQFVNIKNVIDKLDIRRKQVFVEVLIFEIQANKATQFGVEWRTTQDFSTPGAKAMGGTDFGSMSGVTSNPLTGGANQGLVIGVVDGVVNFGGKSYANVGGLVHALRTDTDVNILSTPNLLTTDNEEAEIFVGSNVPFVKSTAQTTGATPIENIERQDIGITLRVKPQINENDYVRLNLFQEISSISPAQLDKAKDIITNKRTAKTVLLVRDNQNIVIGGLIQDDVQDIESKVPLLGDLPLIGWLFKSISKKRVKTNLLIFLTPHIIHTADDMDLISGERRKRMDNSHAPLIEEQKEEERLKKEQELKNQQKDKKGGPSADGNNAPAPAMPAAAPSATESAQGVERTLFSPAPPRDKRLVQR